MTSSHFPHNHPESTLLANIADKGPHVFSFKDAKFSDMETAIEGRGANT